MRNWRRECFEVSVDDDTASGLGGLGLLGVPEP